MKAFQYVRPSSQQKVLAAISEPNSKIIAGGTNLIDLMKRGVVNPEKLVDINELSLGEIASVAGSLTLGALAINSAVAADKNVIEQQPLLSMALKAGASPQLRNMATVGGNIMQRTRCSYFYDTVMPCNKRSPGTGCGALKGYNRMHAIFGASEQCIAVHPSDMCVALAALDATVKVTGKKGDRIIPFYEFHRLPGTNPSLDNTLSKDELILSVEVPKNNFGENVYYLKIRDRQSYAFALVSVAAALEIEDGTIKNARIAMGGVAHKPWRASEAEQWLAGKKPTAENFQSAAEAAMKNAKAYGSNNFKLKMAPNAIVEALKKAAHLA